MSDFKDIELEEESSFSNTKGFFILCSQLMFSITHAETNGKLQKLHDFLYSLYGWMIANYNDKERLEVDKKFEMAQQHIYNIQKHDINRAERKVYEETLLAKKSLTEIKYGLVEKMHEKNLLYPVREKGSALWN